MKKKYKLEKLDCEIVYGFNSKQIWVYEANNDVYIDPPAAVLKEVEEKFGSRFDWDWDKVEAYLLEEVKKRPDWLLETDYWSDSNSFDI